MGRMLPRGDAFADGTEDECEVCEMRAGVSGGAEFMWDNKGKEGCSLQVDARWGKGRKCYTLLQGW